MRLDRAFANLFEYLDRRVGVKNVLITLSADHGFMNIPEYCVSRSLDADRIDPDKNDRRHQRRARAEVRRSKVHHGLVEPESLRRLRPRRIAQAGQDGSREGGAGIPTTYPGVEAVFTRTQLEQGQMPNTKMAKQVALAWHQPISGDIVIMNKPNRYLFAKPFAYAATHGSPWAYDTNVPLAMYGPNWVKSGKYGDSETVDLGRTIAHILNVRPPNGCEGRVLTEAMR